MTWGGCGLPSVTASVRMGICPQQRTLAVSDHVFGQARAVSACVWASALARAGRSTLAAAHRCP